MKVNVSKIMSGVKKGLIKHSPEILTGIGIAGMITTTVMAVKATPKALILLDEIKESRTDDKKEYAKQVVTKVAPVYIPSAVMCAASIACVIGATSVNAKRNAALATAYSLTESTLREYQEKVIETIGEKKEKAICDEIAKDKIEKNPVTNTEVYITKAGETLFYESISGRYFTSDIEKIKSIQNKLNQMMNQGDDISLNEVFYEFGLRQTDLGNDLGFNIFKTGLIEFKFSAVIADDGRPCIYIGYEHPPVYEFNMYG